MIANQCSNDELFLCFYRELRNRHMFATTNVSKRTPGGRAGSTMGSCHDGVVANRRFSWLLAMPESVLDQAGRGSQDVVGGVG